MSKLIKIDKEYAQWIKELSERFRASQIKAAVSVNREMLRYYWSIGRDIVARDAENYYGAGFYKNLSEDLKAELPGVKGLSEKNLQYMKRIYSLYSQYFENRQQVVDDFNSQNCPQAVGNLPEVVSTSIGANRQQLVDDFETTFCSVPWGHHCRIIDKFSKDPQTALFYIRKTVENGWSRGVLEMFIEKGLHKAHGKAVTNFSRLLPPIQSDLAQAITKDPYTFDFVELTEPYRESELKKALIKDIEKFLLELGKGFAYMGSEFKLKVGNTEQYLDMLFYIVPIHAYCVVEVKVTDFNTCDVGQLGTYMVAVNHILKTDIDNPTIGLLICKNKDQVLAQYALESSNQPIGISEYELTKFVPSEFKSSLPSIEDIETELS